MLARRIQQIAAENKAFDFLNTDEDLCAEADSKEGYSGFRRRSTHHIPITDLSGSKQRPAVLLTSTSLDLTVRFVACHHATKLAGEYRRIAHAQHKRRVRKHSLTRSSKIATLDKALVKGALEEITKSV